MSVFKSFKPDLRKLFNIHALKIVNFAQNISQYFRKSSIWFQWSICRMTKWFCHPLRPLCTDYSNQIVYKKLYQKAIIKISLFFSTRFQIWIFIMKSILMVWRYLAFLINHVEGVLFGNQEQQTTQGTKGTFRENNKQP